MSIYTPAYNEQENLPVMYDRLRRVLDATGFKWEWIVVDDHSADGTFRQVARLASVDSRVRGIRLSKNFGSHAARTCALQHARGDCAIGLAADLQDPPERIPEMLGLWREGAQMVVAVRAERLGEKKSTVWLSEIFRWLMRRLSQLDENEAVGASYCLMDRRVVDAFLQFRESNVNALILTAWMGFRQARISYDQQPRLHGASGWTLKKKLKLAADSITSFSSAPLRLMYPAGLLFCAAGAGVAAAAMFGAFQSVYGSIWAAAASVGCLIGGILMLMIGAAGEYLWRALDEARRRPRYLIEDTIGVEAAHFESSTRNNRS